MRTTARSLAAICAMLFCAFLSTSAFASCAAPANVIERENCLPGAPATQWDVHGVGDASIQGFATDISVNAGDRVDFKINTNATNYRLDIYRMAYYNRA